MAMINETSNDLVSQNVTEYVTVLIGDQLFGLPISRVQDVFMPDRLTRVPLSAPEIAGVLNLRGRIVTAVDMRRRLGLPPRSDGKPPMAVGIELKGESYGLLIDTVGEVLKLADNTREPNPSRPAPEARFRRRATARRTAHGHPRRRPRARNEQRRVGGLKLCSGECERLRRP